jgi:hypothetical protein
MEELKRSAGALYKYIPPASNDSFTFAPNSQGIIGVRIPKPIGIITFEDIIDSILQRTSRDEKDFFERNVDFPPTKSRKAGDPRPPLLNVRHHTTIRGSDILLSTIKKSNMANLRKRNITARIELAALDGAQDTSSSSASTLANNRCASNTSTHSMLDCSPANLELVKVRIAKADFTKMKIRNGVSFGLLYLKQMITNRLLRLEASLKSKKSLITDPSLSSQRLYLLAEQSSQSQSGGTFLTKELGVSVPPLA